MALKKVTDNLTKLENRVKSLERKLSDAPWKKQTGAGLNTLMEKVRQQRYHRQKKTLDILSRTFGTLSKKRADEITKHIISSRKAWK